MGIFQTKPTLVEAEQMPAEYKPDCFRPIITWLIQDNSYRGASYFDQFLHLEFYNVQMMVPLSSWIVKLGEGRYQALTTEEFNARYSWIGPKEHYDAPYMVG